MARPRVDDNREFRCLVRPWIRQAVLAIASLLLAVPLPGQPTNSALEARVKSAYIYNFLKFIDWPVPGPGAGKEPILICVIGKDPVAGILTELESFRVKGRPLRVRYVVPGEADVLSCQVLFLSSSEHPQLKQVLEKLQGRNVLTISDIPGFARQGGIIGFVNETGKVKIEINLAAARQANLKISAKLLEVARIVDRD